MTFSQETLAMPLTQIARRTAQTFAQQQPTDEKAAQVRLNTLAVFAMHDYLQLLGFETDLAGSYSWNPVGRLAANVADLRLPGRGHLECLPVLPGELQCQVSLEVWDDRIGYVVVQVDESNREVTLLGFVPEVRRSPLLLSQLQPLDHLLLQLHQPLPAVTHLGRWLDQVIEVGWETVADLLTHSQAELAIQFRGVPATSGIRRGKVFDLGLQPEQQVALVVEVSHEGADTIAILLQVHPIGSSVLPPTLSLAILDDTNSVIREIQARQADNYIQLQVNGMAEEQFAVRIALGEASLTERFMI